MKLLRVIGGMDPASGGPCQGIRNSVAALERLGVANEVLCMEDPGASYIGQDNFPVHAMGRGKGPWQYNGKLMKWLQANVSRFDAVIVHGLWLHHGYVTRKAVKESRQRGLAGPLGYHVMPHGMLDPWFQKFSVRPVKAIRNWLSWKLIESRIVNEALSVLFTSEEECRVARSTFRPYRPKEKVVGYGVASPPPFRLSMYDAFWERCPAVAGRPYLLFLSRVHAKKGVDLLVQAYVELAARFEDMPNLVIAGPCAEETYLKKLKDISKVMREGIGRVHFVDMLKGDAKWGAFFGCEAFILPSHQENFGIAVVEALACGKPVLISDQVNIWKEISDQGAAYVAADTLEGTMTLLQRWMQTSRVNQQQMGTNATRCFEARFSVDMAAAKLVEAVSVTPARSELLLS